MVHFENNLGFPLTTNILEQMQTDREVCSKAVAGLLPNGATNGIISGCGVINNAGFGGVNQVTDGVVVIDGELMAFKGGTASPNAKVYVVTETISDEFENGSTNTVITRKYATIGISAEGTPWESFKNSRVLRDVHQQITNLSNLFVALDERINKMLPIGTIAIWGKPASEPIPEGWQECTDLRGRMPVGWNPSDADFNQIGKTGGAKTHILTIAEMPSHGHSVFPFNKYTARALDINTTYGNAARTGGSFDNITPEAEIAAGAHTDKTWRDSTEKTVGGGLPHNNMSPYRIVMFIKYVG